MFVASPLPPSTPRRREEAEILAAQVLRNGGKFHDRQKTAAACCRRIGCGSSIQPPPPTPPTYRSPVVPVPEPGSGLLVFCGMLTLVGLIVASGRQGRPGRHRHSATVPSVAYLRQIKGRPLGLPLPHFS